MGKSETYLSQKKIWYETMFYKVLNNLIPLTTFLFVSEFSLAQVQIEFTIIDCQNLNKPEMNDTLQFIHKNSSQSFFELSDGTFLDIQEIIRIQGDSLVVELLRYSPLQWQKAPSTSAMGNYFNEPPGFAPQPKQQKKLALQDIHFIYYRPKPSIWVMLLPVVGVVLTLKMLGL
ncbi:MAG: hypothetical protein QGF57_02970 [Candidatus Marinimicrobia bacterium]|nr:hypothetical protein [Candidatus Neomarinimicrobiota bacterium]